MVCLGYYWSSCCEPRSGDNKGMPLENLIKEGALMAKRPASKMALPPKDSLSVERERISSLEARVTGLEEKIKTMRNQVNYLMGEHMVYG